MSIMVKRHRQGLGGIELSSATRIRRRTEAAAAELHVGAAASISEACNIGRRTVNVLPCSQAIAFCGFTLPAVHFCQHVHQCKPNTETGARPRSRLACVETSSKTPAELRQVMPTPVSRTWITGRTIDIASSQGNASAGRRVFGSIVQKVREDLPGASNPRARYTGVRGILE